MSVEILAGGRPVEFEPRQISQSDDVTVAYQSRLDPVALEHPKRERV